VEPPGPVATVRLFAEVHAALLDVLAGLRDEDWRRPTACTGWTVHDVVLHLFGGMIGNLARRRDRFAVAAFTPASGEGPGAFINRINDDWLRAARRISPPLLRDLLAVTGPQVAACFAALDGDAIGRPVGWAGPEPAPVWLDVAREYTEWWHHQQHIRDAVARPGLTEPRFLAPALATFAHGLPRAFAGVAAPDGTAVVLAVPGPAGGDWTALSEDGRWVLRLGAPDAPAARATLDADVAWRLFTRGLSPEQAAERTSLEGDPALAGRILRTVSIL
jgi:uncharacterized protein (TIGR03083 family)